MLPNRPRFMELSSRKTSKRAIEPVDEWLQNEGYYRKHAPKDPTCLFRAVSEQVYQSQRNHIAVRNECIEFMKKNRQMFEEKISTPFDSYLGQMACFTEWGGMNEILAMSLLYQRNVVIFHGQKLTKETVVDHGFQHTLNLCFTPPKQYESVYTQEHTADAGFCQSLVYQTLYKNVFKMTNVDTTVHKMLHDRTNNLRHDKFFLKGNMEIRSQLTMELIQKLEDNEDDSEETQLLAKGITPFPYRVAKALDPNIYRNVDYDIWHEIRKEVRNSGYTKFYSNELQAGSKCIVQLDLREHDRVNNNFLTGKENWDSNKAPNKGKHMEYTGHIQEMSKNEGPVVVFIEELGEKMTVPYKCLKAFPVQRKMRQNPFPVVPNKKNMIPQNTKWKKPYNNQTRRIKEVTPTDNNNERNQMNKPVAKNAMNKSEWGPDPSLENQQVKMQPETYPTFPSPLPPHPAQKDYNVAVDNVKVMLENTHVTSVETAERAISEQVKNKPSTVNVDVHNNQFKKPPPPNNYNHEQPNKQQHHQRAEKNDIFYPSYQNSGYPVGPRFPNSTEYNNYDVKNVEAESGEVSSDPATVRPFYNLGVKYYWTQNVYTPGVNGPVFGENTYYITQPPPDVTVGTNIISGPMPPHEHMNQTGNPNQPNANPHHLNNHNNNNGNNGNNGNNTRHNFRSSTPRPDGNNGPRQNGQKSNYRQANQQNQYQSQNIDYNKNRVDYKNSNVNDQQQQQQQYMQNKEMQRGNKNNNMAPRFKKNYDGRNRGEHQYQYNPDYRYNNNKNRQQQQQQQPQQSVQTPIESTLEMNEATMQIQQQQQHSQPPPPPPTSVMQQQQHQQPQTSPPPINGNYPYPLYNQQVSYVPIGPYPIDASEAFPGHFYPGPPAGFVPLPYLPPQELADGPPGGPPIYSPIEAFPPQYPAIYSPQFIPYHLAPPMYPSPPPSSAPAGIPEGCYPVPQFPGQPYYLPYPPPPMPANLISSPQNSPAH